MLRTRILTALVIFPVTLAVVFLATPSVFKGAIAILLLAGCLEFRRICALSVAAGAALRLNSHTLTVKTPEHALDGTVIEDGGRIDWLVAGSMFMVR